MGARKKDTSKQDAAVDPRASDPYALDTPRWRAYYEKVRRGIRFPRYYKRTLNW